MPILEDKVDTCYNTVELILCIEPTTITFLCIIKNFKYNLFKKLLFVILHIPTHTNTHTHTS